MKIAVPTRDGAVDNHFGHCAYYTIYEVVNGEVSQKMTMASPQGCGCKSNIASVFREMGVRLLFAGKTKDSGEGCHSHHDCQG